MVFSKNRDLSNQLPLSAGYWIDREQLVDYAFVNVGYRKRAEQSAVLAALRGLKQDR